MALGDSVAPGIISLIAHMALSRSARLSVPGTPYSVLGTPGFWTESLLSACHIASGVRHAC